MKTTRLFGTSDSSVASEISSSQFVDKRGYAARWQASVRWVDNLLAHGLPHLAIGKRRVRIDILEADRWMKDQYGTQRMGKLNSSI